MAFFRVSVISRWPTTPSKSWGRYLRAMTWYDIGILDFGFQILDSSFALACPQAPSRSNLLYWEAETEHRSLRPRMGEPEFKSHATPSPKIANPKSKIENPKRNRQACG